MWTARRWAEVGAVLAKHKKVAPAARELGIPAVTLHAAFRRRGAKVSDFLAGKAKVRKSPYTGARELGPPKWLRPVEHRILLGHEGGSPAHIAQTTDLDVEIVNTWMRGGEVDPRARTKIHAAIDGNQSASKRAA